MEETGQLPVLVVGAGPVGLFLACELRRHGVPRVRIVDRKLGPAPYSKALAVHARTMEILDDAQLAQPLLQEAARLQVLRCASLTRDLNGV